MILVITLRTDTTMERVTRWIQSQPVIRLNIDDNPFPTMSYRWESGNFQVSLQEQDLREVTSVWFRIAQLHYLKEVSGTYEMFNRMSREEMVFQLYGLLEHINWVSSPFAVRRAENKGLQLSVAQTIGLRIPETLVTSNSQEAMGFRTTYEQIIVKPLAKHMVRVADKLHCFFTARITPGMPVSFDLLPVSPAIFQREIIRECDIRVIVVGEQVFALAIKQVGSKYGGVDYRISADKDLEFESYKLPKIIEEQCLQFVRYFGLQFSAMDFILGIDGNLYFLENNPCGSWIFVEEHGHYPISQAIAQLLK